MVERELHVVQRVVDIVDERKVEDGCADEPREKQNDSDSQAKQLLLLGVGEHKEVDVEYQNELTDSAQNYM